MGNNQQTRNDSKIKNEFKTKSRFLSLVLRHKPELINLQMEKDGWVLVDLLIEKIQTKGFIISKEELELIVATNDKKRFSFNETKTKIRANQGHSIDVDLGLEKSIPPEILYHGTAEKNLTSIFENGIQKQKRNHVHLSSTIENAMNVGKRHGKPKVLEVLSGEMHRDGFEFYISANHVWLTDFVPKNYIVQNSKSN
ncbi:MAG: RNA 2'-phosphotransferase [Leptospiraceae bacterium]|nr:RNA 2'-phosphotransferase [Leptospiraceae bacterium]